MRASKSILAGVAAGALGLALVPFVGVGVASATSGTASAVTVSPVRVTFTGNSTTADTVPNATLAFKTPLALTAASTSGELVIITAPSTTAQLNVGGQVSGTASDTLSTGPLPITAGDALTANAAANDVLTFPLYLTDSLASPGSYSFTFTLDDGTNTVTASGAFTTTGKATSISLAINAPAVPKSTTVAKFMTVGVKDSAGRLTQLVDGDSIAVATTESSATLTPGPSLNSTALALGAVEVELTSGATAGAFTASAVPQGTLPSAGATTQTGNYTVIDNVFPVGIINTNASNVAVVDNASTITNPTIQNGQAYANIGLTKLDFALQVASVDAGKPVVISLSGDALLASTSAVVETNSSGVGTFSVNVPAALAVNGRQVDIVAGPNVGQSYDVDYLTPYVDADTVGRDPSAPTIALATGKTQAIAVFVGDQYGNPVKGYPVTAISDVLAALPVSGLSGNDGLAVLTLPDLSTASDTSVDWTFTVVDPLTGSPIAGSPLTAMNLTLTYSASGTVTVSGMAVDSTAVANYTTVPAVPFGGVVGTAPATNGAQNLVAVSVNASVANTQVVFTGSEGVNFVAANAATAVGGTSSKKVLAATATSGTATVYAYSTKAGKATITATSSSGAAVSGNVTFTTLPAAARDMAIAANPTQVAVGKTADIKVTVSDVFGNRVALTGTHGDPVVQVETDKGVLAGGVSVYSINATNSLGEATISLTNAVAGESVVSAIGKGGQFGDTADVPFTGAKASVNTGVVKVTFGPDSSRSITITGSRTTVSGKPGIKINGAVTGIENGKTVVPYFRFPGETTFAQGSARPVIEGGKFTWQRKTGKKFYAYVTNDDGAVKSNRVIIAAN